MTESLINVAFPFPGGANSWPNKVWFGFCFFVLYLALLSIDSHGILRVKDYVIMVFIVSSLIYSANSAMPNDESVLTLMGKTAMDKNSYGRQLPRIDCDKTLFPD